jgi:hypothetical protein
MIASGYEDGNDATTMRSDPAFKLAQDVLPSAPDLASQPTLSRLENWTARVAGELDGKGRHGGFRQPPALLGGRCGRSSSRRRRAPIAAVGAVRRAEPVATRCPAPVC